MLPVFDDFLGEGWKKISKASKNNQNTFDSFTTVVLPKKQENKKNDEQCYTHNKKDFTTLRVFFNFAPTYYPIKYAPGF